MIKLPPNAILTRFIGTEFDHESQSKIAIYYYLENNGSQLKNPDISEALYTLQIQYSYSRTQCEDGDRDFRVLKLTSVNKR